MPTRDEKADSEVTLIAEDGSAKSIQSLASYLAEDDSFSVRDLNPRSMNLEEVREKMGAGVQDAERRREVHVSAASEIWSSLRGRSYADLKAIAEGAMARAKELRHRLHKEADLLAEGAITSEDALFSGDHHYYANYLCLRASLARQAAQIVEEQGEVPEWDDLPAVQRKSLLEVIEESPQTPRKTLRVVEVMQDYFSDTTREETPENKGVFFEELASTMRGTTDQVLNRIDGYCRAHGIDVPSTPNGYREILNL